MNRTLIFFCFVFLHQSLFAQYGSNGVVDARSMSMGKTYNSNASGIYSIGINPANILKGEYRFEISSVLPLPAVSVGTGSNFISLDEINYYFGGVNGEPKYLTEQDKQNLNKLFSDGGVMFASVSANLFSFKFFLSKEIGSFAFSINDFASSRVVFPRALVDVALTGNELLKPYNFDEADVKAWWIRSYSLSYAREIFGKNKWVFDSFNAGISFKLVHGFSYAGTERNNTNFSTGASAELIGKTDLLGYSSFSDDLGVKYKFDSTSRKSHFSIFPSPAGVGFGFDLGASASLERWNFSLSVTDIGKIKWDKNVAEFSSLGNIYIDDLANKEQRDSAKEVLELNSKKTDRFYTSLATAIRFGASYLLGVSKEEFPGTLLLSFDFNQGLNNMPGNNVVPRFSIGAEWKPKDWFPYFRTGFSLGGGIPFGWAFGIGVDADILELHFATSDMQGAFSPNSSKVISFSLSSRWKF
jgi:hypothetical protein